MTIVSLVQYSMSFISKLKSISLRAFDAVTVMLCGFLTISVENGFTLGYPVLMSCFITGAFSYYLYNALGLYRYVVRFMANEVFIGIMVATLFISATFAVTNFILKVSVPAYAIVFFASSVFLVSSMVRASAKSLIRLNGNKNRVPVLIYGAGSAGRQLMSGLSVAGDVEPVGFIDDDITLHGKYIHGKAVFSIEAVSGLIHQHGITKILLAMPSASAIQRNKVITQLEPFQVEVQTIASISELVSGKVQISQLTDVSIEDLLGRDPVRPQQKLMGECLQDKVVLITGAGGSIGSELCRQVIHYNPSTLIILEMSEYALYAVHEELKSLAASTNLQLIPILGSAANKDLLIKVMSSYSINTVYHAAAYKHVPLVEYNVIEGVKNNIMGTLHCAQVALMSNVEHFVLISTDKAVRPTNFMGASKRISELVLQAFSQKDSNTKFSMVRFGNVLGSSGSVVPLFKKQISGGGPVTVTHRDITRYFMTIPEAAQLVIQAGALAKGGDVFVLDMGEPVKIANLAEKMIHLMGYEVCHNGKTSEKGIEVIYSGLRPGEKLYEELLVGDSVEGTAHPRIMTANETSITNEELEEFLVLFTRSAKNYDCANIEKLFLELPIQFTHKELSDVLLVSKDTMPIGKLKNQRVPAEIPSVDTLQ